MTVTTAVAKVSYAGDGVANTFVIPFRFQANSHVRAVLRHGPLAEETVWTEGQDYTLIGANQAAGGALICHAAPVAGSTLVIYRDVPITQETDYVENDPFPAESHERALDKLTMIAQQLAGELQRSFKLRVSDPTSSLEVPDLALRRGKYLYFDPATGEPSVAEAVLPGTLIVSAFWQSVLDANTAAAARPRLGAAGLADLNTFTADQTIRSVDGGPVIGPRLNLVRASPSPEAEDGLGAVRFMGTDSAGTLKVFADIITTLADPTTGSETAYVSIQSRVAGGATHRLRIGAGLWVGAAIGGFTGHGSVNAAAYFRNGARLPLQESFESAEQVITPAGQLILPHGLGDRPKLILATLVCKSAEFSYVVGDEVPIGGGAGTDQGGSAPHGCVMAAAPNYIVVRFGAGNNGSVFRILRRDTGAFTLLTDANWRLVVRAWN